MEPNESNPLKSQPTGGLKLMTVFIAVLALHVLVIGGFTVWHLLYPANVDSDMALDKTHKAKIVSDSSIGDLPASDSTSGDKTASAAPPATDSSSDASTVPDASATASTVAATPGATAAAATAANTPAPAATAADSVITVPASPTMPATPTMAEDTSAAAANPPAPVEVASGPVHNGPVVNPPDNLAPPAEASAPNVAADSVAPAVSVDGLPYTVKRGDSLAKIAHRHHIALAKLRAANSLASDSLHIGQKLVIPGREPKAAPADAIAAATPAATPASPAPTAPVAQPVTAADLSGSLASPSVADTALPTHAHKTTSVHHLYTVVKGDTLTKIAKRYHTTTSAIMAANNLTNAGRLSIGQKLHIPSHQMREATAEEPAPQETAPHTAAKGQLANYTP